MGRPRGTDALTEALQKDLCKWVSAGNYIETACNLCGVPTRNVRRWMRQGQLQKRGKYREFLTAIKKAEASVETRSILRIEQASATQWQAAAWLLERKTPERWARTERHELTGKGGKDLFTRTARDGAAAVARVLAIDIDTDGGSDGEGGEASNEGEKAEARARGRGRSPRK